MKCSCARSNRACLLSKISPTKFLWRSASVSTSWSPPLIQFEKIASCWLQAANFKQLIAKLKNFQTGFLSWSLRLGIATRSNKISSASSSTPYFSFLICFRVLNGLYVLYLFNSEIVDQIKIGSIENWINEELVQLRFESIQNWIDLEFGSIWSWINSELDQFRTGSIKNKFNLDLKQFRID